MEVTVQCDRCKKQVNGIKTETATGGFYEVANPLGWGKYADPGEKIVCDNCMWNDPRYIAVYGKVG